MRFLFLAAFLMTFAACARPQYLSPSAGGPSAEKASAEGCKARFSTSNLCADFKWEKHPTETEYGSFILTTMNSEANVLTDASTTAPDGTAIPLKVVLWMPSMGHGSAPVKVERLSTGLYRASNVFFSMKGDWEIRFQVGADQATYALFLQ